MILTKEQINRYLRHIIIPEISGSGQKKLAEAKLIIFSSSVNMASSAIYYLAASGIGNIYCHFNDNRGYEELFKNINDLNDNVKINLANCESSNEKADLRLFIFEYNEINLNITEEINRNVSILTVVTLINGWKGSIQTIKGKFSLSLNDEYFKCTVLDNEGSILSVCFAGAVSAIECIKNCLKLGSKIEKPLNYDLLSMEFSNYEFKTENQEIKIKNIAKKLSDGKVLIVGTGGLGSPVIYALSKLGIGKLGVVDYDKVEVSNLNRQIVHSNSRIGMPKVESAKAFINSISLNIEVITYNTSVNINNVMELIKDYDVIVDAVDDFPARYLLNDACFFAGKPLVDVAAVKFSGLAVTIIPGISACYRCLFPNIPGQNGSMRCSESGVLGPVPGVMGFIQASEIVKLLLGKGNLILNKVIYYDALDEEFNTLGIKKSEDCKLCGTHPSIMKLVEYSINCETKNH